jgi:hypothetical protein
MIFQTETREDAGTNHASAANLRTAGNCIASVGTARPGHGLSLCVRDRVASRAFIDLRSVT